MARKRPSAAVDHEGRKHRILDAADAQFGEAGYDGTSARDVAVAAGVNKALIFYYFGSKDGLFEAVLQRYYDAHVAALRSAFEASGTVRDRMHGVVDAYIDFIDTNRRWPRLVQSQLAGTGSHVELIGRNLAPLYRWTEAALADIATETGPLAARHFFLTFSGAVINYFTYAPALAEVWDGDPLGPKAVSDRRAHLHWLVDALLDGLERGEQRK